MNGRMLSRRDVVLLGQAISQSAYTHDELCEHMAWTDEQAERWYALAAQIQTEAAGVEAGAR